MDVLGQMIKTPETDTGQLGDLIGVQKAQISKLESSANSATVDAVLKVFKELNADIHFNVRIENKSLQLF